MTALAQVRGLVRGSFSSSVFPFFIMETLDQPKILKRFTCGGDPGVISEIMVDRQAKTQWVRLWLYHNSKWIAFNLDKNRVFRLESILKDTRKVLR